MTAVAGATRVQRTQPPPVRALLSLPLRLARRGAVLLALSAVGFSLLEVISYRRTYPTEASREQLDRLGDDAAVRLLQGAPRALDTVGGFVVWDAGWFLGLLVGTWSVLVVTRLLRADEDTGRSDLVLARPVPGARLLLAQLAVVLAGDVAFGLAVTLTLLALGLPSSGAVLFGAALAGFGAVAATGAAVLAQLFEPRRRAVAAGVSALGLAYGLRMLANSQDGWEWLLWLTPFGWLDSAQPFAAERWAVLALHVAAAAALTALAVRERARRDCGAGRLSGADRRSVRPRLLGGPVGFAWRNGTGAMLAWAVGALGIGMVTGAVLPVVVRLVEEDEQYRRLLAELGFDLSTPVDGFLAAMAVTLSLLFVLQVCWRIGAGRAEEASGRLDLLLVRPLARWRWLLAVTLSALLAGLATVAAAGAGLWTGAALAGTGLGAWQVAGPLLATVPLVVLYAGLAVLAFGALPRLTIGLPAALAVAGYLLVTLGPQLGLPQGVVDLSPFAELPSPLAPWSAVSAGLLTALGLLAGVVGAGLFQRRDLVGD